MPLPIDINLAPDIHFSKSNILDKLYIWGTYAGKTLIIVTNFVIISIWLYRWDLDRRIYNLATSIQEKQLAITSISKKEATIRKIQNKLNIIREIENQNTYSSKVLNSFNQSLIQDIEVGRITFPSTKLINLSATAKDGTILGTYIQKLIKSENIEDVTLFGSFLESATGKYSFVLEIKFR